MRVKIRLDTQNDIMDFIKITTALPDPVYLVNKDGTFRVSGKSLLGAMYTMEWDEVYCESEKDIYHLIEKLIIE